MDSDASYRILLNEKHFKYPDWQGSDPSVHLRVLWEFKSLRPPRQGGNVDLLAMLPSTSHLRDRLAKEFRHACDPGSRYWWRD